MGFIGRLLGFSKAGSEIGQAIEGVAEVFVPNATKEMVLSHAAYLSALNQYGVEFQSIRKGWFDRFVNGINRLPRPALAMDTLGLFIYAMVSPEHFSHRMQGLALVPDPLWWLLGAFVSFYFGARELHHLRDGREIPTYDSPDRPTVATKADQDHQDYNDNAALADWRTSQG